MQYSFGNGDTSESSEDFKNRVQAELSLWKINFAVDTGTEGGRVMAGTRPRVPDNHKDLLPTVILAYDLSEYGVWKLELCVV